MCGVVVLCDLYVIFFFKQKTAYEMRISDWSSDVCSSDLVELIKVAVQHAAGRLPVIAGIGGNSTSEAIELSHHAKEVGAQAGLSVVPYYNKPTQEGLYQHFKTISEAVDLPAILYNVPGRTVADMSNDRSEAHTSELQSLMRISYDVFCLKKTNY